MRALFIIPLFFFLFLASFLHAQINEPTQTQFRGVFTWRNVSAYPDTSIAHYYAQLADFNDQTGEYLANDVDSLCTAWDNLGGRWDIVQVDSATIANAWVLIKSLNPVYASPFGIGFVSLETSGTGLSLTAPDNSTGISPQLQARIEGHNMILIDNLFEDVVLNMVDTFYMAADTGDVQQLLATDTIKINGGYGVVTGLSGENRTVVWADTLELSTVYHSEHYADSLFLLDLDQDSTNEIQYVDSLTLLGTTLGVSLSSDGIPAVTVNLAPILSGYTTGSGAAGRVTKWVTSTTLGDGVLRDDGSLLAIGGATVSGYSFYDYSTGAWRLATGTTAQRPTNIAGLLRYNTSLGYSETANGSAWLQSDLPVGATTNTIRHNGTSWIASSNLINDGTVVRAAGATNRIHLYPSDFTDGQTFNGQISLLNNAEAAAAKLAVGGSQLWLRVIGGLSGTGRGILMSPNGAAVLTATNTLLTLNTASASTLLDFRYNGVLAGSFSTGSDGNGHLLVRSLGTSTNRGISVYHHQTGIAGASQMFYRSRGTGTSPTTLASGDIIGANVFRPYDGSNYTVDNCFFGGSVTGAVSAGNTPSSLFFIAGPTQSYLPDLLVHSGGNVGVGSSGTGDITSAINTPPRQLTVYGEARITDLATDTPTRIVGADADGDLSAETPGFGLAYTGGVLQVDSTKIATQSDLASVSVTTLYTGDGTIATDRTVTLASDKTLTISGTTPDLPGYLFTEEKGYSSDWDTWGNYRLISTDDYFTNFVQGILNYDSTVFLRISAGDQIGDHYVSLQMDGVGNLALTGLDDTGTSAGLNLSDNATLGGYGARLAGGTGVEFDADTGGKFVYQVNNSTKATLDATGLGINDTSPEKSLDVGGMGKFRQLSGQDNSVTIGTNANMGTGRSASITDAQSSDVAGRFSFTSGTTLTAGEWVTLTWGTSFDNPPAVVLMPENANAASIVPYLYVVPSTTGCSIVVNVTGAPYEGLTFEFNYIVIQGK